MSNQTNPSKPMKSLAQVRRNDGLVETKIITQEVFDRDLLDTDLETIPWRVGPAKAEDPDEAGVQAFREVMLARKAELLALRPSGLMRYEDESDEDFKNRVSANLSKTEAYNPQGEGLQEGGEGLEMGRPQ